jgi:hypothetical protein
VSLDFHLITRQRPSPLAFARTLSEAAGGKVDIVGDFADPDDYLNVTAPDLWLEVEPPGHVEYADLRKLYPADDITLPDPDDDGCLWHTVASLPAGAPPFGEAVITETFQRLAASYEGVALEPE